MADSPGTPAPRPPERDGRSQNTVNRVSLPPVCHTADGLEISCGSLDATVDCVMSTVADALSVVGTAFGGALTDRAGQSCLRQVDYASPPPEVVAQSAVAQMTMEAGQLHLFPEIKPDGAGIVGMNAWAWLAPGPTTTGPQTVSVTAGATTVTATARVISMDVDTGEDPIFCYGPGTVFDVSYLNPADPTESVPSPTCGYQYQHPTYDKPDGVYVVTATIHWEVAWTSTDTGETGTIPADVISTRTYPVHEIQVLVDG